MRPERDANCSTGNKRQENDRPARMNHLTDQQEGNMLKQPLDYEDRGFTGKEIMVLIACLPACVFVFLVLPLL